jgi:hypothetical protein
VTDLFTDPMSILGALPIVVTGTRSGGAAYVPRIEPNLLLAGATSRVRIRGEYRPLNDGVGGKTSRLLRKRSRPTQFSCSSSRVSLSSSMVTGASLDAPIRVPRANNLFRAKLLVSISESGVGALFVLEGLDRCLLSANAGALFLFRTSVVVGIISSSTEDPNWLLLQFLGRLCGRSISRRMSITGTMLVLADTRSSGGIFQRAHPPTGNTVTLPMVLFCR